MRYRISHAVVAATAAGASAMSLPAAAQDAASGLEDIVVTASRRAERMQDVGISLAALSGDTLTNQGITSGRDLARAVPGINFTAPTGGSGTIVFNLRGVGLNDFGVGNEGPVAIYVDDVYNASLSSAAAPMFDLERVEVLRGPQGTLFGRNATGGLVQFISRAPTDRLGGQFDVRAGADSIYGEAALNLPLSSRLAARIAVMTEQVRPYIRNYGGSNGSGVNKLAGRFRLAYTGDTVRADLILRAGRSRSRPQYSFEATGTDALGQGIPVDVPAHLLFGVADSPALARLDDGDPFTGAVNTPGHDRRQSRGATLRLSADVADGLELVSISDITENRTRFLEDTDVTPLQMVEIESDSWNRQVSQELRLARTGDTVNWVAGGYFFTNKTTNDRDFNLYVMDAALRSDFRLDTTSYALFGEVSVRVAPTLTLVGGLRWTRETRSVNFTQDLHADLSGSGLYAPDNYVERVFTFTRAADGDLARSRNGNLSGRARIEWRPSTDFLLFAAYNRGFKSGGFNNLLDASYVTPAQMPYAPETLDAYDLGFKSEPLRGIRLNADAFYYNYHDFQAFRTQGLSSFLANAKARIYGVDVDFGVQPLAGLDISGGFELLHTRAYAIDLPDGSAADRRLANAPSFALTAGVHYEAPVAAGTLRLALDGRYTSAQFFNIDNSPVTHEDGRALVDARIGYRFGDRGPEVYVLAVNLFDKRYRLYAVDVNSLGFTQSMYAEPRRVAAGIKLQF